MRRLITSFLVLTAATACAEDPMTPGPPEPGRPLADIIRTGGIDASSSVGLIAGLLWPPAGWGVPDDIGWGDLCWVEKRCALGDLVNAFGDLKAPESPHPVPPDSSLFGHITTQDVYAEFIDPQDPVTVLASGVEVDFYVPPTGSWALSLDYAVLAAGGTASSKNDVARAVLVDGASNDDPGTIVATLIDVARSALGGGDCGTLELPTPDELIGPSTSASYDDCTAWQRLQFDLSEWPGKRLTLRFRVEEVGDDDDDKPIALAFDNVQVVETFTREAAAGTAIPLAVTPPFLPHREPAAVVVFETFEWTIDPSCTLSSTSDRSPTATCSSPGTYEVVARMTEDVPTMPPDEDRGSESGVYYALGTLIVTDANTPPAFDEVAGPADPIRLGRPATVTASFTDPDMGDAHTATFDWGDGMSTTLTLPAGARNTTATHSYAEPGVYAVEATVADAGGEDTGRFESVVIIDPDGGFVAGGGWFHSPAGAFRHDPTLTGRLTVAFAARYHRNGSVPRGHTLVLRAFKFLFRSVGYEWLVVSDGTAQYQGTGTVNGKGDYGFRVTAVDGGRGWHSEDNFKIKVWDRNDGDRVVYDNAMPVGGGAPSTLLRGGAIVIHEKKERPRHFHWRFRDPTP